MDGLTPFEKIIKFLIELNQFVVIIRLFGGKPFETREPSSHKLKGSFWDDLDLPEGWTDKDQKELEEYLKEFDIKPKRTNRIRPEDVVCYGMLEAVPTSSALFEKMLREIKEVENYGKTVVNPPEPPKCRIIKE